MYWPVERIVRVWPADLAAACLFQAADGAIHAHCSFPPLVRQHARQAQSSLHKAETGCCSTHASLVKLQRCGLEALTIDLPIFTMHEAVLPLN